jgi:hypothetical protein
LRILVEGQASLWFKGVDRAVAAARAMTEPAEVTVVAPDPEAAGSFEGARVVGALDPAGMAAVYAEHHVLLKLSRIEGLALAPLEAMHVGRPAVVTPYSGHDEAVVHGRSGLVVPFDDEPGTVRALDRLARDRGLLEQLSAGALETAARWPGADDAATAFANAVRGIAAAPEPDADAAQRDLQLAQRRWLELGREYGRRLDTVHWYQRALAESRRHTEELNAGLRVADTQLIDATRTIEDIKATRAYRFGVAARRFIPGRRS